MNVERPRYSMATACSHYHSINGSTISGDVNIRPEPMFISFDIHVSDARQHTHWFGNLGSLWWQRPRPRFPDERYPRRQDQQNGACGCFAHGFLAGSKEVHFISTHSLKMALY